ncbi:MAG: hypothetical protein NZ805_00715 [Armatimonadetes bacterium]|nr:hypothetical protein [Armatimonadota bacterium]MDW8027313.1 hypothetical protein [Armatimonadota bacterium]
MAIERYFCACRRFTSGFYPDAISHAWAACELALEKHAKDIGVLRQGKKFTAKELIDRLRKSHSLLNVACSHVPNKCPLLDALDWLREKGNQVIHGVQPVNSQLAQHAIIIAETLLKKLGCKQQMLSCPLRPELVQKQLLRLIQVMRDSLWQ